MERKFRKDVNVAVAVVVCGKDGVLLILDPKFDLAEYKFPGGHAKEGESPREAAIAEVREETGVVLELSDLVRLHDTVRYRGTESEHRLYIFGANVTDSDLYELAIGYRLESLTGELVKRVPLSEVLESVQFRGHQALLKISKVRKFLEKCGLKD